MFQPGFPWSRSRGKDCIKWLKRDVLPREHVRSGGWGPGKGAVSDNVLERLAWPELWNGGYTSAPPHLKARKLATSASLRWRASYGGNEVPGTFPHSESADRTAPEAKEQALKKTHGYWLMEVNAQWNQRVRQPRRARGQVRPLKVPALLQQDRALLLALMVKNSCASVRCKRWGFNPWVRKILWRRS